ncbi:hypothetical protein BH11PSE9_BH11PSE9_02360 [soil metagenome]
MDEEIILSRLAAQVRDLRLQRGLTQAALAERAGVPRLKVVQVEAGNGSVAARTYARLIGSLGAELSAAPARRPTLDEIGKLLA